MTLLPLHTHNCTLCQPARVYSCTVKHRGKWGLQMLSVWRLCPVAYHAGELAFREAQSGAVAFEHREEVHA